MALFASSELVGIATTLRTAYDRASNAAPSTVPVALFGRPGVGKETFAAVVSNGAYLKLSCALLNSKYWTDFAQNVDELFARGVNGASTLYLSEVEVLSKLNQRRLALCVNNGALRPRVVLGVSTSYLELRAADALTPELNAVLTAYPISLPPLRERGDDLPELARLFLDDACAKVGAWPRALTQKELERLAQLDYPENLDDLRRYMELVATTDALPREAPTAAQKDASTREAAERPKARPIAPREPDAEDDPNDFPSLEEAEIRHIERALRLSNGVVEGKTGAAALLKINPYTLRSRMRKMKVDWTKFRVDDSDAPR